MPLPASSGRTDRHRPNRGGARAADNALHTVALTRLQHDSCTRGHVTRRSGQGLSKKEIERCLKPYVAPEVYRILTTGTPSSPAASMG